MPYHHLRSMTMSSHGASGRRALAWLPLLLSLCLSLMLWLQSAQASATQAGKDASSPVKVVATFSILADMVEQVGGDLVQVHSLVGRDSDAHVFQPTPRDTRELAQADLVVINGLGFEGWIERLIKASGFKGPMVVASKDVRVIEASQNAPKDRHGHAHGKHDHAHGPADPHAWQSLHNAKVYVSNIRDALIAIRPQHKDQITSNAAQYVAQLDALDQRLRSAFESIPKTKRKAIISHDAFNYLAREYDIEFLPVRGWSTGREASASDVANLIRQVREGKVQAFFIENMSDGRVLERIAQETGAKSGGTLYSDALSAPGTQADTYLKLYETNAQRLIDALQ